MATKKLKEKNSFMMYHTWINQFNMLSPEEFVNMVNNLYRCDKGQQPILNTQMEKVIWEGMGFVVEANKAKWEAKAEQSRLNGAKGGAPVKITKKQSQNLNNLETTNNPVGYLETQNNPVGFSNDTNNQVGFSNNLNNLINVKGEMVNDNGELVSDNSKLENANGERLNVNSKGVIEKGELESERGKMINHKGENVEELFEKLFGDIQHTHSKTE